MFNDIVNMAHLVQNSVGSGLTALLSSSEVWDLPLPAERARSNCVSTLGVPYGIQNMINIIRKSPHTSHKNNGDSPIPDRELPQEIFLQTRPIPQLTPPCW
jgi:hypothetical protein